MKTSIYFYALSICALLTGCGEDSASRQPAPPPPSPTVSSLNGTLRVGDKISVRLLGVPGEGAYFNEYQIPASGDINVPQLTQSFHAVGRNPGDLGSEITEAYKTQQIYTNPVVTVLAEERYLSVGGDVRGPTRVTYSEGLTAMSAINFCGGFTEYADRRHVRILRGQQRIIVDCVKAATDPGADPAVYPGDQIYVPRSVL